MSNKQIVAAAINNIERRDLERQERKKMFIAVSLALLSNYPGISDTTELTHKAWGICDEILSAANRCEKEQNDQTEKD